jgi:signal transduction histidine kinase
MKPRFLEAYRTVGRHTQRFERNLAAGRAFLATSALVAIYFDPTEPARFAALVYTLLAVYALYSIVLLWAVRRSPRLALRASVVMHGVDLGWASALTFFSEGPASPFFLFFLFVVLAAAYRWGFRETLATAGLAIAVFLLEIVVAEMGPWSDTWFAGVDFVWTPVVMRTTYLLITGVLLAYLAEREKQFRAEMSATADAMRQPRVESGTDGSVVAIASFVSRAFRADTVDIVIQDHQDGRTLLWHAPRYGHSSPGTAIQSVELDEQHRAAWLFSLPPSASLVRRTRGEDGFTAVTLAPDTSVVSHVSVQPPPLFRDNHECQSFMSVDFGLADQWRGRLYLFDAPTEPGIEARLAFLESLAEHITPVLSNVLLLQRLRASAGAEARARVARDLHDGAIQTLVGIDMETTALRRRAERSAPSLVPELERIQTLLRHEVIALRELMQELRPVDVEAPGCLPSVLSSLVARVHRDTGIDTQFVCNVSTDSLPLGTAVEIVRIVQEALVNVRKHSGARHAVVRLTNERRDWTVAVEDDGRGFEFEGRLAGAELEAQLDGPLVIRERARAIGGQVTIESARGKGACVEVCFHVE